MSNGTSDSIISYSIYTAGIAVGSLSLQDWLILVSLVAVLLRLPVDARKLVLTVLAEYLKYKNGKGGSNDEDDKRS